MVKEDLSQVVSFRLPPALSRGAAALVSELGTLSSHWSIVHRRLQHPSRVLATHRFAAAFFSTPNAKLSPNLALVPAGCLHLSSGSQWKATELGKLVTGRRMKNHISSFVKKRDKRRIRARLRVAVTLK